MDPSCPLSPLGVGLVWFVVEVETAQPDPVVAKQRVEPQTSATAKVVLGKVLGRQRPSLMLPSHVGAVTERDLIITPPEVVEQLTGNWKRTILMNSTCFFFPRPP
jgi:hypothetical protein